MKGSDRNKAIVLVVLLVLVVLVLAWNMGWLSFGGGGSAVAPAPNNNTAGTDNAGQTPEEGGPANRREAPR